MDTKTIQARKIKATILLIVGLVAFIGFPLTASAAARVSLRATGTTETSTVGDSTTRRGQLITSNTSSTRNLNARSQSRPASTPHVWTQRAHLTNHPRHGETRWGFRDAPQGHRWRATANPGTGSGNLAGILQIQISALR